VNIAPQPALKAFHRTIFVFCCTNKMCYKDKQPTFIALRSQLPRTVRVFRQKFTLEDAIGSHACSL
jgi:hypothetical protein